jgi:hypothetical protein
MASLDPSAFGDMSQATQAGSYIATKATVQGLPEELEPIRTLLETATGFPDDPQALTQEQTEVLKEIASLLPRNLCTLLDEDPSSEDKSVPFPLVD